MPFTVTPGATHVQIKSAAGVAMPQLTHVEALELRDAITEAEPAMREAISKARTASARKIAGLAIAYAGERGLNINPTRAWTLDELGRWVVFIVPAHLDGFLAMQDGKPLTIAPGYVVPVPTVGTDSEGRKTADYRDLILVADDNPQLPPMP